MSGDFDGIILRSVNYGESNKIIEVFTKELGKITAIAKSNREFKKSKGNISEPFLRLNLNLIKGKKFFYLNQSNIIEKNQGIREDIDKMFIAAYISEMTVSGIETEEENRNLYELLCKTFKTLSDTKIDPRIVLISYQIKFLSFIGYRPMLKLIGENIEGPYFFNYEDGGIISYGNKNIYEHKIEVEAEIINLFIKLLYIKLENLNEIEASDYQIKKMANILYNYMVFHIEKQNYKSLKNLKDMKIL